MTKSNWWMDYGPVPEVRTLHEQYKPWPAVVYDHTGQPLVRPRQPIGFYLSGRKTHE